MVGKGLTSEGILLLSDARADHVRAAYTVAQQWKGAWREPGTLMESPMSHLEIQLFGGFHLAYQKDPVASLNHSPRLQSLLAFLLLHRQAPQSRQHLAFLFWPASTEAQAFNNLRTLLRRLQQALPDAPRFLSVDAHTVQWRPDAPFTLDVSEFEDAIRKSERAQQAGNPAICRLLLEEAVELYAGDLLPSCYDDWILSERERLRQVFSQTLDQLIRLAESQRDYRSAIRYGRRLLQHDPLREVTYRRLMRLYALTDDRARALRVYQTCVETLERELGVEPGAATRRLHAQLLEMDTAPRPHNLPVPSTPFVGREKELAEITALLRDPDCGLLTLVGPGGIGKTRLALQAVEQVAVTFLHGACFVPLASVSSAAFLVPAIAEALQFAFHGQEEPRRQLLSYLREKELLLILDSFEHLLTPTPALPLTGGGGGAASLVQDILQSASDVKIMVTSRERLNLQGEWRLDIGGLPYPEERLAVRDWRLDRGVLPSDDTQYAMHSTQYAAVQLFLQSARQAHPNFTISEADEPFVVRICQLVEGMPLGIELAAAWVPVLACWEIAREIEAGLDFLATSLRDVPERHRSLRAVFEHSWNLLSEEEQGVFRRLSVFRGGFRREAGARVAGASLPVLRALASKSFLQRGAGGRFEIHELLRQFGEEKLDTVPSEAAVTRERHSAFYAAFVQQRETRLKGEGQKDALAEIGEEMENVRAAWQWAVHHRKAGLVDKALESLYLFYEMCGRFHEGEELFRRAARELIANCELRIADLSSFSNFQSEIRNPVLSPSKGPKSEIILAKALARQGWFCHRLSRYGEDRELLENGLAMARRLGDEQEVAFALNSLGNVAYLQGAYAEAERRLQESLAIRREMGDRWGVAHTLNSLGNVAHDEGAYTEAKQRYQESVALFKEANDQRGMALALNNLGNVARMLGEYTEARQLYRESLALKREIGDRLGIAYALNNLGYVAGHYLQDHAEARELLRESLSIFQALGDRRGMAYALSNLGDVARDVGEYAAAQQRYQESLAIRREIGNQFGIAYSLNRLGEVGCALRDFEASKRHFHAALKTAMDIQAVSLAVDILAGVAALLVAEGEKERALEPLLLALRHPAADGETKDRAERLLSELTPELPRQVLAAAEERTAGKDLAAVVEEILFR